MKTLRISTAAVATCVLLAAAAFAESDMQKGTRLALAYDRLPTFGRVKAMLTLRIYDRNGNERFTKKLRMASYTENLGSPSEVEKFIGYFTEPADDMGNSMLFYNYADKPDEKFMYLKSIRKVKKVTGADKKLSFFGSDFSNAEVSMPEFQDYNYRYLKDSTVTFKGKELECYVIECVPKTPQVASDMGYSKKNLYIEKKYLIMMKTEYYDEQGAKWKEHQILSFLTKNNVQGKMVVYNTAVEMRNVKTGTKSRITFSNFLFEEDSGVTDRIFSVDYLTRKWW